tara:strand:+ start:25 stop:771 length:747 start_codon:yes stop_codon:yes gene_type:complete
LKDLVSIITPTYNSEEYISVTINSILSQTYSNFELIIIDDFSTDNTLECVKKFDDKRIKILKNSKNRGAAFCRNKGLKNANGRYLSFCDSDDFWEIDKTNAQIKLMKQDNCSISFTSYSVYNSDLKKKLYKINVPNKINYEGYLKNTIIGMSTSIIDKNKVKGIEFVDLRIRQDTYLWMSLLKRGIIANGYDLNMVKYRLADNSISSNKFKAAKVVWHLYYDLEKLGFFKSSYYFLFYIFNALKKRLL